MFRSPKKAVSEHQFRENEVACKCCHEKLWGFTLVAIIQYIMFLLQLKSFKSQNFYVYFSNAFTLETRLPTSPILVIYFQILCSTITWMTIIRVTKSTLTPKLRHWKPYVAYVDQTRVEIPNVLITGEFCNLRSTLLLQPSICTNAA